LIGPCRGDSLIFEGADEKSRRVRADSLLKERLMKSHMTNAFQREIHLNGREIFSYRNHRMANEN
jgi:hypothetical protein